MPTPPPESWNGRPPRVALDWAARCIAPDARVLRVRRLGGGNWLATDLVVLDRGAGSPGEVVLRRWARPGWAEEQPTFTAATEAAVLDRLAGTSIPSPRVLAVDPTGDEAGVPAILQTRLPGRPPTYPATRRGGVLAQLATALVEIHNLDMGLRQLVPSHQPYSTLDELAGHLPPSTRPDLWRRAIDLAREDAPPTRSTFLHRDYHPANTLWRAGTLTGIVDWTGASWGPPASDLAHLRANLGVGHDPSVADRALAAYVAAGGAIDGQRWWDVRTLLDWVPLLGQRLGTGEGLDRVERWLAHVLDPSA